jgi:deoxyhypusine monooxygenase
MVNYTPADLTRLESCLYNKSGDASLAQRFRALFTLKALAKENEEAICIISRGTRFLLRSLCDNSNVPPAFDTDSALLKHELAYCLGQTKNTAALPTLEKVLADEHEDPMVRHEVSRHPI